MKYQKKNTNNKVEHDNRMKYNPNNLLVIAILMLSSFIGYAQKKPIVIQDQGSFAVGGSMKTTPGTYDNIKRTPEGQTFHGDHAYVFYQEPVKARKYPFERKVILHTKKGYGLTSAFIRFCCAYIGQLVVEKSGLLPYYIYNREIVIEKKPIGK